MKISGFTFLRNGEMLGYPFVASIKSILPLVDEFVIALGPCEDNTEAMIEAIGDAKIRIIHTTWNEKMQDRGYVYGQQKMIAQFNCSGDWAFYLEGDEVLHEEELEKIYQAMLRYKDDDDVEALTFDYLHFYGNINSYLDSPAWYRREARVIKNSIRSYAPDGLFWLVLDSNKKGRYPKAAHTGATIYHYGWVRSEDAMNLKSQKVQKYWNKQHKEVDYTQIDAEIIKAFQQTHPKAIEGFFPKVEGIFQADRNYRLSRREKRHRWMMKLEKLLHLELSKKHYKLIK
jgi:glycosyltransferase involved in cell wall biosynthesis